MIDLKSLCADMNDDHSAIMEKSGEIIPEIYRILESPSQKTREMTEEQNRIFRYLYGSPRADRSGNNKLDIYKILNRYGIIPDEGKEAEQVQLLFYAVQTYFSILIKLVVRDDLLPESDCSDEELILGEFAKKAGIKNFCDKDQYTWPVYELENGFAKILAGIKELLSAYRSGESTDNLPEDDNADHIRQMYEALIPKELRHALGEFYTPGWLAEDPLNRVLSFENIDPGKRFLDPTCGSGTFIIKVILAKKKTGMSVKEILSSVSGMDINPLAVLTARTNFLLSITDMIDGSEEIELPIYNMDILDIRKISALEETGPADVIIGNPPWVNWEYLPSEYRSRTQYLWQEYGLLSAKGRKVIYSKEDISVLITYVVMDKLLKQGGVLAFVIRQAVFKSAMNGGGFRKFKLKDECGIRVLRVDDLSGIRVFKGAMTNAAIAYLKKGEDTEYPVPYFLWDKNGTDIRAQYAKPAVEGDPASMWMNADRSNLEGIEKVLGSNPYRARTGVFTGGANAVYWLNILGKKDDGIEVTNITERAKRKAEKITKVIEPDHVFPMLKGRDVNKWDIGYDSYILCPHTAETKMWPVSGTILEKSAPKTIEYLRFFKDDLDDRKGFAGWEKEIRKQEFHAVLRVGEYTFSEYKVVWRFIASEFICSVIGSVDDPYLGRKLLLPNEKIMYVSTDDETEAYYLCGVLSSKAVSGCIKSFMNPTSISAHVLEKLNIPAFNKTDPVHMEIARICKAGHMSADKDIYFEQLEGQVALIYG